MRVHLDTDFGGDPDDACALAMLLGYPDVEIVGITTNLDSGGRRAGCVEHYLKLAGRDEIPVAAGAEASLTTLTRFESTWGDTRYWPEPVVPRPAADLPRLRAAGQLGQLLARQSEANAADTDMAALGRSFSGLRDDLVNFHWDPVTCAVGVGWPGATVQELRLAIHMDGEVMSFRESAQGRRTRVVVDVDAGAFTTMWLSSIEAAHARV